MDGGRFNAGSLSEADECSCQVANGLDVSTIIELELDGVDDRDERALLRVS
jgi:hypothetical protein